MKYAHTLAFRLFLLIAGIQTVVLAGLALAVINVHQSQLREDVLQSATRVSHLIARATQSSMLADAKDDVQVIISAVGGEPGIDGIRIFNKGGTIVYSTLFSESASRVPRSGEVCSRCHEGRGGAPDTSADMERLAQILHRPEGGRQLSLVTPIRNMRQCSNAACHAHPMAESVLGLLEVRMSLTQVDASIAESVAAMVGLSVVAIGLVGIASGGFLWWFVRRPVRGLILGMNAAADGRLHHRLKADRHDELGDLAQTFNRMMEDLERARQENLEWSLKLEEKVREKTSDLEHAHHRMARVEKMASLGTLAAGVAHELNNPLGGILTFSKLTMRKIQKSVLPADQREGICADLQLVADEAARCGEIVRNLLVFARHKPTTMEDTTLRPIVERSLALVQHLARSAGIDFQVVCPDEGHLTCDSGQIQQVLLALLVNAIEAVTSVPDPERPRIVRVTVTGDNGGEFLRISVADTGVGMSDDVRSRVCEPFFTTKSDGKSVGLGLAIAFGIIEQHSGRIEVDSTPGRGSVFTIVLPVHQRAHGVQGSSVFLPERQDV
jgi:two-component system NtrC family sensor kinase